MKLVCVRSDGDILFSSRVHLGILPGRMRRQKWKHFVTINDIVLVGCREFETEDRKVDILHKYTADAAKQLIKMGSIPNEDGFDTTSDVAFTLESGSSVAMCPTAVAGSKSSVAPSAAVTITEDSSATAPYTGASVVADDWEETFDDI